MPNYLLVNESIFKRVLREKQHKSYPKTIIYLQSILNFRTFPLEIVFIESVMVRTCVSNVHGPGFQSQHPKIQNKA